MRRPGHEVEDRAARPTRRAVFLHSLLGLAASAFGVGRAAARQGGEEAPSCGATKTTRVELGGIEKGEQVEAEWNGRVVFVRRRTQAEIDAVRSVELSALADPEPDEDRVQNPEWLVVYGICTHAACEPFHGLGKYDGWLCFCHGSVFDASGRVRKGPASRNLEIPPYRFVDAQTLEIGCA